MKKAILATKVGMTQIFDADGTLIPVTVLQAGPCVVTQVKTVENDGYSAIQVGYEDIREKLVTKPVKGHFDKAEIPYKRYIREFKLENAEEYSVRDEITVEIFEAGDKIDVTALLRVKVTRALLRDMVSQEDLWATVLSSTDMLVLMPWQLIQVEFQRERRCLDIWALRRRQSRILKL